MSSVEPSQHGSKAVSDSDSEIDLVDVFLILWRQRWIFLSIVGVSLVCAALYIYFVNAIYSSEGKFVPPSQDQLVLMLSKPVDGYDFNRDLVFGVFKQKIQSSRVRDLFYKEHFFGGGGAVADQDYYKSFSDFSKNFVVTPSLEKDPESYVSISYSSFNPVESSNLISEYVEFVNRLTLISLKNDLGAYVSKNKAIISQKIERLKFVAEQKREQRVEELQEALNIAKALGINEYRVSSVAAGGVVKNDLGKAGINIVEPPLYQYGVKELTALLNSVRQQKNTYYEISELPELEGRLAELEDVTFNLGLAKCYTEMDPPIPVYSATKPNKLLLVMMSGLFGVVLGFVVVIIRGAVLNRASGT